MDSVAVGLLVSLGVIFLVGLAMSVVLGYFKWKQYKERRIGIRGSRRHGGSRGQRRRARRIRVRNNDTPHTLNNSVQIMLQPPPYSLLDGEAPPPYTPYGVMAPAGPSSTSQRPGPCLTPRPLQNLEENTTQPQLLDGYYHLTEQNLQRFHQLPVPTGTTNTPMTTPAGSMFTTSIGGTRHTSASSNMRSVNMIHIENTGQR